MARPPLPLGTPGNIYYNRTAAGWRARCFVRDYDGRRRQVERWRKSQTAAGNALRAALRDRIRVQVGDGDIGLETKVSVLAESWFQEQSDKNLAVNTLAAYRRCIDLHIVPALGEVRLRELTVGTIDRFIKAVNQKSGPAQAKQAKSAMSGMMGLATRHDAVERNLVADTGPVARSEPKEQPKALTVAQLRQMRAWLTYDARAISRDIPALVDFLMCTGVRIGEACGLTWGAVNLVEGWVEIRSTVVRVKGEGLINQPRPKTKAGYRRLQLPSWMLVVLCDRFSGQGDDVTVFPAPKGGLRDGSNTQADLRDAFGDAGFGWATSHIVGRKSVATILDLSGSTPRQIADQLGQANPSMTLDLYMGRKIADSGAAELLEILKFAA